MNNKPRYPIYYKQDYLKFNTKPTFSNPRQLELYFVSLGSCSQRGSTEFSQSILKIADTDRAAGLYVKIQLFCSEFGWLCRAV